VLQEKFNVTLNFDLMINFNIFDLITLESHMVSEWNLVCGRS